MNKIKELDWKPIHSTGEEKEFLLLEEWANLCRESGGRSALEIGSFHGKSTTVLAQFFNPVYAVDLWGDKYDGVGNYSDIGQQHFTSFIKNMVSFNLINQVIPIVGTSEILNRFYCLNVDFIYIDASHSYDDVKQDLFFSVRHLSEIGVIVGDDYKRPGWGFPSDGPTHSQDDPWPGVARAFDEFLVEHQEFYLRAHTFGKLLIARK